jgi:hypothetical protein
MEVWKSAERFFISSHIGLAFLKNVWNAFRFFLCAILTLSIRFCTRSSTVTDFATITTAATVDVKMRMMLLLWSRRFDLFSLREVKQSFS